MNTTELRKVCGHDSWSVEGCIVCEAADMIDRNVRMQKVLNQAYEALSEEEAAYDPPIHHVAEARKELEPFYRG